MEWMCGCIPVVGLFLAGCWSGGKASLRGLLLSWLLMGGVGLDLRWRFYDY